MRTFGFRIQPILQSDSHQENYVITLQNQLDVTCDMHLLQLNTRPTRQRPELPTLSAQGHHLL